jgi:hypothetical protein
VAYLNISTTIFKRKEVAVSCFNSIKLSDYSPFNQLIKIITFPYIAFPTATEVQKLQSSQKKVKKFWYLSAIEIIDTQVARRGRQYHRNPPPYKKNRIYK